MTEKASDETCRQLIIRWVQQKQRSCSGRTNRGAYGLLSKDSRQWTCLGLYGHSAVQGDRVLVAIQEGPRPHELNAIARHPFKEQSNLFIGQVIPAQGSPVMPAAEQFA